MPDNQQPRIVLRILTEKITPRLSYIVRVLFSEFCGINAELITDRDTCIRSGIPFINYTSPHSGIPGGYLLPPAGLLFEEGIREQDPCVSMTNGNPAFFKDERGDFPFDIFAASFYLITRYEEYLPHQKDAWGRFCHEQSLAYRNGFLDIPLVEFWLKDFLRSLHDRYPDLPKWNRAFSFRPTYDIDIAYAYLHRGWLRGTGGFFRSVVKCDFTDLRQRIRVIFGLRTDPFDVYDRLDKLHSDLGLDPVYFILLAKKRKGYDRNIDPAKEGLRMLVRRLSGRYETGLHPSWQSGDDERMLAGEKKTLSSLTGREVVKSRQHYIRMSLPKTYRALLAAGIESDHSMGYPTINGFRASVSSPFSWYDLSREKETDLMVHPFCFMDANAYYEQRKSPAEALVELEHYIEVVGKSGGTLSTIWHNDILGDMPMFSGWWQTYVGFLDAVKRSSAERGQ